ncbi:DUF6377 domain-containing protein [Pedobacter sp.]
MRIVCAILLLCFVSSSGYSQAKKTFGDLERRLDDVLQNQDLFVKKKQDDIEKLKNSLRFASDQFDKSYQLCGAYRKFQTDSALRYALNCKRLAVNLPDSVKITIDLDVVWIYSTVGRYVEAENLLSQINRQSLPKGLLAKYYDTYSGFYSHYGQSNNYTAYYNKSELYRDSLLAVLNPQSTKYRITYATKVLFAGKRKEAKDQLSQLLNDPETSKDQLATVAYLLGLVAKHESDTEQQRYYYTLSACNDIESATRDNASLQDLALTYYESGDFDRAFKLIEKAIKDAIACNTRYRIIEGTSFYPIINAAYQKKIDSQNKKLMFNLILISILSLVLIVGIIVIYRQVKRLNRIKSELSRTNIQLQELNTQVSETNTQLSEANHIKEEYIAQFFDMCSSYIEKMDSIRKHLLKKATTNQTKSLIEQLKSTQMVEKEVEELYYNFDQIFLNLYPSFVEEFNALLKDEEKILPKKGELLNTELRIFALIRLGIDDSIKIASFLRYSLRTVYNYRTKVRNKAAVSRADFEDMVKQIAVLER